MLLISEDIPLPTIQGEGFVLRPYRNHDAASLQHHINDSRVARDVSNIPYPYTLDHAISWLKSVSDVVTPESTRVDFVIDVNGEVVGSVAFIEIDKHKAQTSVWVNPNYWRKGLALNALKLLVQFGFEKLRLVRIYAYHYTENHKTANLLEKAGFTFDGVHPKEWLKEIDGEQRLFDSNYYSIVQGTTHAQSITIVTATGEHYARVPAIAQDLEHKLANKGCTIVRASDTASKVDLAISLGGDGTMMKTVSQFSNRGIPTLGINAGNVGFLTSAEAHDLDAIVDRIVNQQFTIERRLSLRFKWNDEVFGPFANEVALWHPDRSIATIEVSIGGEVFFERLSADGVLVATATGSTAYNASAGGPIITPESSNVVINALNPPMFNMRPVVTDRLYAGQRIELKVVESKHDLPLTIGADSLQIKDGPKAGESLIISRHPQSLLFATFGTKQYVKALKGKMNLVQ